MDSGDGFGFGSDEGPSKTQEARDSPESSDQSGSPPDRPKGFFSDKNFEFARKLFSTDAQRASLQVFPSVTMVRISVTDSGAGISKVSIVLVYAHVTLIWAIIDYLPRLPLGEPGAPVQGDRAVQCGQAAERPGLWNRPVE